MHLDGFYFISFRVAQPNLIIENAIIRCHPLKWLIDRRNESAAEFQQAKDLIKDPLSAAPPFMKQWVVLHWEEISEECYNEMAKSDSIMKL